jgi:hypothetical protein
VAAKRRKPKLERKEVLVRLRVGVAERDAWELAAKQDGRTLSGWLRFIANLEAGGS